MRYSTQIKPISYVKAHAAELLDRITEEREPIIITQNGEERAVLMDVAKRFEGMESGAARTALAQELFGKTGSKMIPPTFSPPPSNSSTSSTYLTHWQSQSGYVLPNIHR